MMKARVYKKENNERYTTVLGKVYIITDDNKLVLLEHYSFLKFCVDTFIGSLTFGKKGLLKTYKFIDADIIE